jgi:glycosyltransferase involved in cell wall biosynthesis
MTKVNYIISGIDKAVFFEHTALRLRASDIDLSFILINCRKSELSGFLKSNGFTVYFIEADKLLFSLPQIIKCASILRTIKPDAVHCHLAFANFIGLASSFLAGIPVRIYTRHSGQLLVPSSKERLLDHIQNRLSTTIVAITENTKQLLMSEGVPESKIKIVHHGFDISRMMNPDIDEVRRIKEAYNPGHKYPVVGVIARWMKWKGIQYIIPAFEQLLHEYPNALLCLFNASDNADHSAEIHKMLGALPQGSYRIVHFEKNIYDLYHLFDIYVHVPVNPYCEAFGQTYVEALAAGVPSIFTMSGVAREFITAENAYIVDFQNSDEIFMYMKAILSKQKDPEVLKRNGQEAVSRMFSLEQYISTLLSLYR